MSSKQYLVLKLDQPAIVTSIMFGKFHKAHPCNLRDFKVFGGPSPDPHSGLWMRLLRGGLRNDAVSEEFPLRWTDAEDVPMPIRYIKLVPLAAHSNNYNCSIWHVALRGVSEPALVRRASIEYDEHRESETMRLILKHLRSRGHHEAFTSLLKSAKLEAPPSTSYSSQSITPENRRPAERPLEHPIVTRLFEAIMKADWDAAEQCLELSAADEHSQQQHGTKSQESFGLFQSFVSRCAQQAQWTRLDATDADGDIPSPRGGHQLIVDSVRGTAYLFGGWSGERDLCDLWVYHMAECRWRRISADTREQGGPGPRSCHKMAYSSRSGLIYVLGRYVDYSPTSSANRPPGSSPNPAASSSSPPPSQPAETGTNERQTPNVRAASRDSPMRTSAEHAMSSPQGNASTARAASGSEPPSASSGGYTSDFYRFSTRSERWDRLSADTFADGGPKLIFDHQMVVDDENQMLYVFGGRVAHWDPGHLELSGMWKYDCIQRSWTFIFDDDTRTGDKILSRAGHSMLLDVGRQGEKKKQLWIIAGQRGDTYLADMHVYDLNTKSVREISHDYSQGGGPEGGFTQRATIDCEKRQIYLFSGLIRRLKVSDDRLHSAFWLYRMDTDNWEVVWQGYGDSGGRRMPAEVGSERGHTDVGDEEDDDEDDEGQEDAVMEEQPSRRNTERSTVAGTDRSMQVDPAPAPAATRKRKRQKEREPQPRYASEMIYDPKQETFLLFGGNPSDSRVPSVRLDDLWSLNLLRPGVQEILRRAKFTLRRQRFREMAQAAGRSQNASASAAGHLEAASAVSDGGMAAMEALMYLQTQVSEVVDHNIEEESRTFRQLVTGLLQKSDDEDGGEAASTASREAAPTVVGRHHRTPSATNKSSSDEMESDGLPAVDEDADLLSISQTLMPPPNRTDVSRMTPLDASQRLPPLFAERLALFRSLLAFYPAEAVEPVDDLEQCVTSAVVRRANSGCGGR